MKSAKGTASSGRFDRDTQAIFSIRGVPLNACGLKLDKVLLNEEFRSLIQILGCNVGTKFDISKMRYNKIILLADSDSDGFNITSLLCAFFITHLPELVKKGYIYKAVSPLYKIKSKYKQFVLNKQEYAEVFERNIRRNMKVYEPKTEKAYTDKELQKLLLDNRNYLEELHRTSNHLSIDPVIVEFLAIHRNNKDFNKVFKKKFPELTIDSDNILSGIYNGKFQIVTMDKLFNKKITPVEYLVHEINKDRMYFKVSDLNNKEEIDKGIMTLGDFLSLSQKYQPIIETRYKGVGELRAEELRDNTLDPNNRILIRLTIDDMEKDLETFNILHGSNTNARDERKFMMQNFKINRDDLDN